MIRKHKKKEVAEKTAEDDTKEPAEEIAEPDEGGEEEQPIDDDQAVDVTQSVCLLAPNLGSRKMGVKKTASAVKGPKVISGPRDASFIDSFSENFVQ